MNWNIKIILLILMIYSFIIEQKHILNHHIKLFLCIYLFIQLFEYIDISQRY